MDPEETIKLLKERHGDKLEGIKFDDSSWWETVGEYDMEMVFRAIPSIVPDNSVIYIEGTSMSSDVEDLLKSKASREITKVMRNTLWPESHFFHISVTSENLDQLANISAQRNEFEVCDHFQIYFEGRVILSAHDLMSGPILIAKTISEDKVSRFAKKIGCSYKEGAL